MRVATYLGTPELEQRLRLALRLRWPDADILPCDTEDHLLETGPIADIVFLDESSARSPRFELIRTIQTTCDSGIVFLSSEPTDEELLEALEAGADDYLQAAFSPSQLVARVGALLRRLKRGQGPQNSVVHCGPVDIRLDTREVRVSGHELRLTPTEFNLMYHLAVARGGTMTAKVLQKLIWECDEPLYIDSLRKYVQRLRKKLHQLAMSDLDIVAIRGVGYRLAYRAE